VDCKEQLAQLDQQVLREALVALDQLDQQVRLDLRDLLVAVVQECGELVVLKLPVSALLLDTFIQYKPILQRHYREHPHQEQVCKFYFSAKVV
jgi:hypothetical protein